MAGGHLSASAALGALERHQVACYLLAIAFGGAAGLASPTISHLAGSAITPCLIVLLLVTFLELPIDRLAAALTDLRFLGAVLGLNFIVVPLLVATLHAVMPLGEAVVVPALIVLLTPCIDYVLVFTKLAGGAADRLLVLTPLLMIAQVLLLPVYLWVIVGSSGAAAVPPGPFVEALALFVIAPLLAAIILRRLARSARWIETGLGYASRSMVVIMSLTLSFIAAAQIPVLGPFVSELGLAAAVFVLFAVCMVGLGRLLARLLRLPPGRANALIFSGVTRNSLVMLPIVRAVDGVGPGAAVVVSQTIVELFVMLALVRSMRWIAPPGVASENR